MNLEPSAYDRLPVPSGMWGLGPELPRRVPLWAGIAWLGDVIGADTTAKVFLVVTIVAAFVGAVPPHHRRRRVIAGYDGRRAPPVEIAALGAAVLYGCGPFLLTRLAVGHWPVVLVMAALPWALPTLAEPRSLRRVAAVGLVFSIGGVYGGIVGGAFLLVGILDLRAMGCSPCGGGVVPGPARCGSYRSGSWL